MYKRQVFGYVKSGRVTGLHERIGDIKELRNVSEEDKASELVMAGYLSG